MIRALVSLFILCLFSQTLGEVRDFEDFEGTTIGYTEENNGDTLRITEDGKLWKKVNDDRSSTDLRSFYSDPSKHNVNENQNDLNKITLKEFLEMYSKKQNHKPENVFDENVQSLDKLIQDEDRRNANDNSKRWTLLDVQKHKHPFDDKKGWVSLEPIPWSVSKISKWQSKYKPLNDRPWDVNGPIITQRPYHHDDSDFEYKRPISVTPPRPYIYNHQSTESPDRYDSYYDNVDRPRPTPSSTIHPRPTAYFGHKIHVEAHFPSNSYTSTGKPYTFHKHTKDCQHFNNAHEEIMTDGLPSNFPQSSPYDSFRRRGTEMEIRPESHPSAGEGEWVLLSTTKGYKPPRNRQRSLDISSDSNPTHTLRTTRGLQLTVLPPLKGSKVNMTTSHGGLLQVESTLESVEEAKEKFDRKQNRIKIKGKRKRRKSVKRPIKKLENETIGTFATVPRANTDPGAVMAAVGAGMIPATMAMMVPLAMSGK